MSSLVQSHSISFTTPSGPPKPYEWNERSGKRCWMDWPCNSNVQPYPTCFTLVLHGDSVKDRCVCGIFSHLFMLMLIWWVNFPVGWTTERSCNETDKGVYQTQVSPEWPCLWSNAIHLWPLCHFLWHGESRLFIIFQDNIWFKGVLDAISFIPNDHVVGLRIVGFPE